MGPAALFVSALTAHSPLCSRAPAPGARPARLDAGAEDPQRRDERVELVQRVLTLRLGLELEPNTDADTARRVEQDAPRRARATASSQSSWFLPGPP